MANLDHDELSLIGSFEFDFSDRDEWRQLVEKIAFSLVSPIVLPGRSLMCVVMILSFAVLSLAYHWFFLWLVHCSFM